MSVSGLTGLTPNNFPTNARNVADQNYIVSVALPNAANTTNTNALILGDIVSSIPYSTTETINVQVLMSASNGANNKNINVGIQQTTLNSDGTANSANWVNVALLARPILVSADNNGTGRTNSNVIFKLSPGVTGAIRAQFTGEANGGDASNGTGTLQLLF